MARLVIYGCGGHGREMKLAAESAWPEIVFLNDNPAEPYDGIPVISHAGLRADDEICVAVGSPSTRRAMTAKVCEFAAASVIDPTAIIDSTARIGDGAQICAFSYIGSLAKIGRHFQCNVRSHVHHDSVIGDFVTFSPGVLCLGTVHIEDDVFIGAGAILRNGTPEKPLRIGRGAVVGMGAVVLKDIPAGVTVVGTGRMLKADH